MILSEPMNPISSKQKLPASRVLVDMSWQLYVNSVRFFSQMQNIVPEIDDFFASSGYQTGQLPENLVKAFIYEMDTTTQVPIREEDHLPGYYYHAGLRELEGKLNSGSKFYGPTAKQLETVHKITDSLEPDITRCLQTSYRIVNVRIIKTLSNATRMGPNEWHSDGFPADILKILIYFTPIGVGMGTTEIRLADGSEVSPEGPAGTWLLFRNTELLHRGVPPNNGERLAMELTIVPSLRQDSSPIFAGLNASYPEFPWVMARSHVVDFLPGWLPLVRSDLLERINLSQEAIDELSSALGVEPQNVDLIAFSAGILFLTERMESSLELFSNAIEIHPESTDLLMRTALLLIKMGRLKEFESILARVLKLEPDYRIAAKLIAISSDDVRVPRAFVGFFEAKKDTETANWIRDQARGFESDLSMSSVASELCETQEPKIHSVNIGGGSGFNHSGWLNLDGANTQSFKLTPECRFPLPSESVHTVYTSHCLEHLDDATVSRVLEEARRVMTDDARLILKIPDFDMVLDHWRRGEEAFFMSPIWGFESVNDTWPHRSISDSIDNRAAMIFCGFWNEAYGDDHFGHHTIPDRVNAYHGPPAVTREFLNELKDGHSPHQISTNLREVVTSRERSYTFNHQNAWSRAEFTHVLFNSGFKPLSFDSELIVTESTDIPGIREMRSISMYCSIKKLAT
jgi:tetratricopeptide (TPR) repeat protein